MLVVAPILNFKRKIFLIGVVAVLLTRLQTVWAQPVPQPMSPPRLVNDYAHLFSGPQQQALEDSLVAFDRATSTQIAVVTVNDLEGYPAAEYATRILEQWGVGSREHNNGVVMLVKPRNQYGKGEVFIAVGYGLEGALPDITAGRIIDYEMLPGLREGDYYGAVAAGTAAVRAAVRGEYTAEPKTTQADPFDWIGGLFSLGVIIYIVYLLNKSYRGGGDDTDGPGGGSGGRRSYRQGPILFPPMFGGFGGGRSGGFGGGFGGGGFGGFGGGTGGGGGAGRSF